MIKSKLLRAIPLVFAVVLTLSSAMSCSEDEAVPTEPAGAFLLFNQALAERDNEVVWELLDAPTKALFEEYYQKLQAADLIIERYFDPVDRAPAREKAGLGILNEIEDGRGLFLFLFDSEVIAYDKDQEVGADIEELHLNEDENRATILTNSGERYELVLEDDQHWRISSFREMLKKKLYPIHVSLEALKEYAKEAIEKEEERRSQLLATYKIELENQKAREKALKEAEQKKNNHK